MEFEQSYFFDGQEYSLFFSLADPSEIFSLGYSSLLWLIFFGFSAFLLTKNKETAAEIGILATWVQIWCRVTIDAALLIGISISSLAVLYVAQGISNGSYNPDTGESYRAMAEVLSPLVMAGFMAGSAYVLHNPSVQVLLRISPMLYVVIFIGLFVASLNANLLGLWNFPLAILYNPFSTIILFGLFGLYFCLGLIFSKKGRARIASDAMLSAGLCSVGIFFLLWFNEGGSLTESLDAIIVLASILALCSFWMFFIYLFGMAAGSNDDLELPKKNWHLLEAAAFFFFLVFAPLGVSEHFREYKDEISQEIHNEAQQLEIDQLKAQIKLLTEKVGEA